MGDMSDDPGNRSELDKFEQKNSYREIFWPT